MIIQLLDKIGEGAISNIYEGIFNLNGKHIKVVLKEFKISPEYRVDKTIEVYNKIKSKGIPTLDLLKKGIFERKTFLVLEHLNLSAEYKYVSYNTIVNGKSSDAENIRVGTKLDNISDFSSFLYNAKREINAYSLSNVSLYYDSYFFGSKISNISDLQYKIVDLDNVEFFKKYNSKNLNLNFTNFKDAIVGFINHFVNDSQNKIELINQVDYVFNNR